MVEAQNGSTKPSSHPFHHDNALLDIYGVKGQTLRKVAQAPIGGWAETAAFSRDGRTALVQSMQDRKIAVFRWDDKTLTRGKSLAVKGAGPESFATAWQWEDCIRRADDGLAGRLRHGRHPAIAPAPPTLYSGIWLRCVQ